MRKKVKKVQGRVKPVKEANGPWIIEYNPLFFTVGFRRGDYCGPRAEVYVGSRDKKPEWLYVVTDDYEGSAMLNIETLPMLQRALRKIAKTLAAQSDPRK